LSILIKYKCEIGDRTPIHAFTIGDDNNKDVVLAQDHVMSLENQYGIDIHHHVINIKDFNLIREELPKIVGYLETYDATTIEKSIPFVFLLKYISKMTDVKILLTGDGLDELCGYQEFLNLDDTQFQEKSVQLLKNISKYDLLRCDKIAGSFGLELRQPFLDVSFVEYILSIHPKLKRAQMSGYSKDPVEKYIIRKSFDNNGISDDFYIKSEILWCNRQDITRSFNDMKNQLQEYFDTIYNDMDFLNLLQLESQSSKTLPKTKGEIYYKKIFNALYPNMNNILNHEWEFLWN
jgi:asparagine synthetase B (glutamine-hydrolysing)